MNPKQKLGMAVMVILLIISIFLTALNMSYYRTSGYHFGKLAEFVDEYLTSSFNQKDHDPHPGSIYKDIVVTSHAQQIVFIFASIANYIIIAISLIWLYRILKGRKT
jgi:hypothetical protein